MRWVLDRPGVAAVIVGARNASHVEANRTVLQLKLEAEDLAAIETVVSRGRGPRGDTYALERDREGRHGAIMRYDLNGAPFSARS